MAVIKCKMCGGDIELSPDKTFGTCEYCGSTMTLPKIDDDQRAAAFNRGNHFRRQGEFDKALTVYERIVAEDDTDAEAHWCCALCRFGIEYVEDPSTYEYVPTCHRASFDSILDDVDYLAAVEHSDGITRRQYQKDAAKIAEVQRGILATSQKEEPFDVFICYKETDDATKERTRDSLDAQEIYYNLTQEGYRVFFSRITLEDKAGAEYEPYIFAALNSAKVMVAVGEKPEHFNAVWVKNEWSRFLALMKKDRKKLLLPCYKDMDPYDLPEQLSVLQSYDMAKIGFMQDLIRGIRKVLDADKPQETVVQQTIVQSAGGANLTAQLKRGEQALEDGEWKKADEFFDKALDIDAECAEAFLGKALAEQHCISLSQLAETRIKKPVTDTEHLYVECSTDHIDDAVAKYTVPGYYGADENSILARFPGIPAYDSKTAAWKNRISEEQGFWNNNRLLSRAQSFAKGKLEEELKNARHKIDAELQRELSESEAFDKNKTAELKEKYERETADALAAAEREYEKACLRRIDEYESLCNLQDKADSLSEYEEVLAGFKGISMVGFKDCDERARIVEKEISSIHDKEEELMRPIRAQKALEEAKKQKHQLESEKTKMEMEVKEKRKEGIAIWPLIGAVGSIIMAILFFVEHVVPLIGVILLLVGIGVLIVFFSEIYDNEKKVAPYRAEIESINTQIKEKQREIDEQTRIYDNLLKHSNSPKA